MDRITLVIFIAAIVGVGVLAGGAGLFAGSHDNWSPRDYVSAPGDCIVYPQGDPLYDEHYAKNVNTYNCDAYKTQSEARNIDADTRATDLQTQQGRLGTAAMLAVALAIVGFFVYAATR